MQMLFMLILGQEDKVTGSELSSSAELWMLGQDVKVNLTNRPSQVWRTGGIRGQTVWFLRQDFLLAFPSHPPPSHRDLVLIVDVDLDGGDVDDHNHLNGCSVQGSLALVVPARHGEAALEQELDHLQDEFQLLSASKV